MAIPLLAMAAPPAVAAPPGLGSRARLGAPPGRSRWPPAEGAASARQRPAGSGCPRPRGDGRHRRRSAPPAAALPAGGPGGGGTEGSAPATERARLFPAALPLLAGLTALPQRPAPNFAERDRTEVGRRDRGTPSRAPSGRQARNPPLPLRAPGRVQPPRLRRRGTGSGGDPPPRGSGSSPETAPVPPAASRTACPLPPAGFPSTCRGSSPPGALKSSLPGDAARSRGGERGRCCRSRNPPRRGQHPPSGAGADGAPVIPATAAETSPRGGLPAAGRAAWGGGRPGAAGGGSLPFLPARSGG